MKPLRIVYYNAGRVDDETRLYYVGLVIAYSLLLSNSIRRDAMVVVDLAYRGVETRLIVRGWRVKHLRLDASSLLGFVKKALAGRIRGVAVTAPTGTISAQLCIDLGEAAWLRLTDAIVPGFCPALRASGSIALLLTSSSMLTCRYRVSCSLKLDKIWLRVGVAQLMLDWWLERGRPAGQDS